MRKTDFDFYLSEMSVSDLHGGGLTLQRVIGDDLSRINKFLYLSRFAEDFPPSPGFLDKSIGLYSFWEGDFIRKIIGKTLARSINKNLLTIKLHATTAAKKLNEKLKGSNEVTGLICPQSVTAIFTLEALKRYRKVKYITWIMDDHMVKFLNGEWQYPDGVEMIFAKHLLEADHVFVISPTMQNFYRARFGVESTVLFGSSDANLIVPKKKSSTKSSLKIGYFGAVAAWQLDAIQIVARSLQGTDIKLHIYSGVEALPEQLRLDGVFFEGRIDPDCVLSTMQKYDSLLLPISFLEKMRNMSEFNIATKMSEYLASGVTIFAVGPEYAAMIKYLKINRAAILATSTNDADIKESFRLLNDEKLKSEVLLNAGRLVLNETGNRPMRKKWLNGVNF